MKHLVRLLIIAALLAPIGLVGTATTHAQTGVVWTAQFFNNPNLEGLAVVSRAESAVNFDWGLGSPAPGTIRSDEFSARFISSVFFTAGNYEFEVLADDDVRLFVDGALLIDTFADQQPGRTLTANAALSTGNHIVQLDYREFGGAAYVNLDWRLSSPSDDTSGVWSASYYANQNLSGAPVFTTSENNPTHYWQGSAPNDVVPPDNWSARWTRNQFFNAGTYRFSVRADDGVRVFVDGVPYINEWHEASAETYFIDLTLSQGTHFIEVNFYENEGLAFLEYDVENITNPGQPPATDRLAEITVYALRVRDEPSTITGRELTQVQDGEVYPVLGRSPDGNWWQINADGIIGWVYGAYVDVENAQDLPGTSLPPGAITAQVTPANLNMREGPSLGFGILRVLPRGTTVRVDGRDPSGNWLRITVDGIGGWISGRFADLEAGATVFELPVVS